jgi:hypothetical protein
MKKQVALLVALFLMIVLITSCTPPGGGGNPTVDPTGTWLLTGSGWTETVVLTATTMDVTDAGSMTGTMSLSIVTADHNAYHIQTTVVSTSGAFTVLPNGMTVYFTYSISGTNMMMGMSGTGYPTTLNLGPYIRQ